MITHDTQILFDKYGGAVPRYTSFPTAVQFHESYTAMDRAADLAGLSADQDVSIYIHIPFCHSLCHYCGCHTRIVQKTDIISDYVTSLCAEIRLAGQYLTHRPVLRRIHFGGGSPNYASIDDLARIVTTLQDVFGGDGPPDIDMECDPRLLNEQKIRDLVHLGVRRFSFGIQDFNPAVQAAINRLQPFDLVQEQVDILRNCGVESINLDLITGLPGQTQATIWQTMDQVLSLVPSRIAVFPYAHVPWMKKHQLLLEKYHLPDTHERFLMGQMIEHILHIHGYCDIGIDHYALPEDALAITHADNTMKRNFQGYTDDPANIILGFGMSAISQFGQSYAQNTVDAPTYRNMIDAGTLPTSRGIRLTASDMIIRDMIMTIMCRFALNLDDYPHYLIPYDRLAVLQQDGLITLDNGYLQITRIGKPFSRVVAAAFDPHLRQDQQRHARAI